MTRLPGPTGGPLLAILLAAGAASAADIDRILASRPVSEGLGIEGVLTVYDETPRMYKTLGEPTKTGGSTYVYEGQDVILVVEAPFVDGRHRVTSIAIRGKDPRFQSGAGVHLGDPPDRVVAILGEPDATSDKALEYPKLGAVFHLGRGQTKGSRAVVGIEARRPQLDVATPGEPGREPAPVVVPAPAVPEAALSKVSFAPAGLVLLLGELWTEATPIGPLGGMARSTSGSTEITVETCVSGKACRAAIEGRVVELEPSFGPNRLPAERRKLDEASRTAMGVDDGYAGLYGPVHAGTPRWLFALRKGDRAWLVSIAVLRPAEPEVYVDLVNLMRTLRVLPEDSATPRPTEPPTP